MISELLLHWIWQKRLYHAEALRTLEGEAVEVISPGRASEGGGPDFIGSEVRIGQMRWVGSIEIDRTPTQWYAHRHHENPQYRTVVLHVVWEAPSGVTTVDDLGRSVPILPLATAVSEVQLQRLFPAKLPFACAGLARLRQSYFGMPSTIAGPRSAYALAIKPIGAQKSSFRPFGKRWPIALGYPKEHLFGK